VMASKLQVGGRSKPAAGGCTMALGFEQLRLQLVAEAVRDWRGQRFLPLYAAGVLAGAGIGIGLTVIFDGPAPAEPIAPPVTQGAPAEAVPVAPFVQPTGAPWPAEPGLSALETPHDQLGIDYLSIFEPLPPPIVTPAAAPADPAPAPVNAPAAVQPEPAAPAPAAADPAPAAASPARPNFYIPAQVGGNAAAEQALLAGINAERAAAGLAPYTLDSGLTHIARIRSQQLIDQGYFGHTDPYGYGMYWELLQHFGYSYAWAGENLARNNYALEESAGRAIISLMNSATHRANILASDFTRIGIGEITDANGVHYYTMIFLG